MKKIDDPSNRLVSVLLQRTNQNICLLELMKQVKLHDPSNKVVNVLP